MVFVFRIGPQDWARCRFMVSRLHQVTAALRLLDGPEPSPAPPWVRALQGARGTDRWREVRELLPRGSWGVDFLTPPSRPRDDWPDELARVAATDPRLAGQEIRRCLAGQSRPAPTSADEVLLARLVELLDRAWHELVLPAWPQVRDTLETEIARRGARMAAGGLGAVLADLSPDITVVGDTVAVRTSAAVDIEVALGGRGLLLVPHAYGRSTGSLWEHPWEPALAYPVGGAAAQPAPRDDRALARLLGPTRARVLLALHERATTTGLATRCALPLSTVSDHLAVLRSAGLVRTVRRRYALEHRRSALGEALVSGAAPTT